MWRYRTRIEQDLQRWQAAGWVSPDGAAAIKSDIAGRGRGFGLAAVLGTLAAVLIGFSAMSFVAANWQAMSKLSRLAVIFAGLWGLLGLAYYFFSRNLSRFGDTALLGATALFGAGIMLIAQMYHMDGHPPDAVWLWGAGTLAAGLLLRSNPVLAAALVLFVVWSGMEMMSGVHFFMDRSNLTRVHWGFLPMWAAVAAGIAMTRWRPGLHLLALALTWWVISSGYMIGNGNTFIGHFTVLVVGAVLIGLSVTCGDVIDRWRQISGTLLNYGMLIAFAGGFALQFIVAGRMGGSFVIGLVALAAILATLYWAWRTDNRGAMWIAYAGFGLEIFSLYLQKIGTLLGTAGFFLTAGLLVAGLAYAAYRLHDSRPQGAMS